MAAGSILLVSHIYNLNILKKDISDIFNISEVTIIKAFKKIFPYEKVLRDTNLTNIMLNKIENWLIKYALMGIKNLNVKSVLYSIKFKILQ